MKLVEKTVKENPLTKRTEVELIFNIEKVMPSREEIKNKIAEVFNWEKEKVVIKKIITKYGDYNFKVKAFLYNDVETLNKYEYFKKKKDKEKEEKGKSEKEEQKEEKKEEMESENKKKEG